LKKTLLSFIILLFVFGCSDAEPMSKQSAEHWYKELTKEAARGNLERAGDLFSSLLGEHNRSPLLKEAMMIMAKAHINDEEYQLADFYLDEYKKRYGNAQNRAYLQFLKLRAKYFALKQPKRDQKLILDTKIEAQTYIAMYPYSPYTLFAKTILSNIEATEESININIATLYAKLDKPKAAAFYQSKASATFLSDVEINQPEVFWFRALFE
jgi:outer membrane protein assembly factor BamD